MALAGFECFFLPPQLLISSIRTLPRQIIGLKIVVRLSRGLHEASFKYEPLYLEISISIFEIRTNFSLALEKVGSYTRGFTVGGRLFNPPKRKQVLKHAESHCCEVNTLGTFACNFSTFLRLLKGTHLKKIAYRI